MKTRSELNGVKVNDWETPKIIYEYLEKYIFNGMPYFDPCPLNSNFNGLVIDWNKFNYINPPYERKLKEAFIIKAYQESKKGSICVLLIPANTETKIFHNTIIPNARVLLIKGRVKFKGINTKGQYVTNRTGQSGSMLVIFGGNFKKEIVALNLNQS